MIPMQINFGTLLLKEQGLDAVGREMVDALCAAGRTVKLDHDRAGVLGALDLPRCPGAEAADRALHLTLKDLSADAQATLKDARRYVGAVEPEGLREIVRDVLLAAYAE